MSLALRLGTLWPFEEPPAMTVTVTHDFHEAYEAERTVWLRRRVLWYCAVSMGLIAAIATGLLLARTLGGSSLLWSLTIIPLAAALAKLAAYAMTFATTQQRFHSRVDLISLVLKTVVIVGLIDVVGVPFTLWLFGSSLHRPMLGIESTPASEWTQLFFAHFFACVFIPWSPREAIRPFIILLPAGIAVMLLFSAAPMSERVLFALIAPLAGLPGVVITSWRHGAFRSRFHLRMLRGHYGQLKQELKQAQRIHEAAFPDPITSGPIRMAYLYRPVQQIGGDYLYAFHEQKNEEIKSLSLAMLDVTGHGITAALTVNRLYGELERLYAERPDRSPGETLRALNQYIHLTLAKHSVFATGMVLKADLEAGSVAWASAGHPPAFLRDANGRVEQLDATAPMLGACEDEIFDPDEQSLPFEAGDRLLAYTDGVIEAKNHAGEMLRIEGMQRLVAAPSGGELTARSLLSRADDLLREYRFGAAYDDTLIIELSRPHKG